MFYAKRSRIQGTITPPPSFPGGNQSSTGTIAFAETLANYATNASPTAGGTFTDSTYGTVLGPYEYRIAGDTTISTFTESDWFTATENTLAFVIIKGDLTINAGQTFRPATRKRLVCIYATGSITVNGKASMTCRGAVSPSPSPNNFMIAPLGRLTSLDVASSVYTGSNYALITTNDIFPGTGKTVATGFTGSTIGNDPPAPSRPSAVAGVGGGNFYIGAACGGGGGGALGTQFNSAAATSGFTSGSGGNANVFSGGSGGGAAYFFSSSGWSGGTNASGSGAGGTFKANGNPGYSGFNSGDNTLESGTGGVLVMVARGVFGGTGLVEANGGSTNVPYTGVELVAGVSGGASGGGIVALFGGTGRPTITASVAGGTSLGFYARGGNGNPGTIARAQW